MTISLISGEFIYDRSDFTVGSGGFPYALGFSRSYRSSARFSDSPLGLGWTHNFATGASLGSNGARGLGEVSPKEAAALIAHTYVMLQLDFPEGSLIDLLIASFSTLWLTDQLAGNAVTLSDGSSSGTFIKLVDGTFNPPPGQATTLTDNMDGTYTLEDPQHHTWNFNDSGKLDTYVDPAGVTVTYNYDDGKLSNVTNGMDRTLTLHYTGDRLTSVSDGNDREVLFTTDGDGNLTEFTDAESQTITYAYQEDSPGLLTQVFLPANPSDPVFTNEFDTLGRVMTQTLANEGASNFFLAGSRAEVVNPAGNSNVTYLNSLGSALREINELGQEITAEFDGLNRLISTTFPELNMVTLTYDNNNNLLTQTSLPKPGSSLSNITVSFDYDFGEDLNWNKPTSATDGEGNITTFTYDESQGTLLTITRPEIDSETCPSGSFVLSWRQRHDFIAVC